MYPADSDKMFLLISTENGYHQPRYPSESSGQQEAENPGISLVDKYYQINQAILKLRSLGHVARIDQ